MKKRTLAIGGLLLIGAIGIFYTLIRRNFDNNADKLEKGIVIEAFQDKRDMKDTMNLMEANRYWLNQNPNVASNFATRSPNDTDSQYFGAMNIKLLRKNGKLAGLVTYYPRSTYEGHILFLAIDEKFRRFGYAQMLMQHALDELKKMGLLYAHLAVREQNLKAQSLYKKLGFQEAARDHTFIFLKKKL